MNLTLLGTLRPLLVPAALVAFAAGPDAQACDEHDAKHAEHAAHAEHAEHAEDAEHAEHTMHVDHDGPGAVFQWVSGDDEPVMRWIGAGDDDDEDGEIEIIVEVIGDDKDEHGAFRWIGMGDDDDDDDDGPRRIRVMGPVGLGAAGAFCRCDGPGCCPCCDAARAPRPGPRGAVRFGEPRRFRMQLGGPGGAFFGGEDMDMKVIELGRARAGHGAEGPHEAHGGMALKIMKDAHGGIEVDVEQLHEMLGEHLGDLHGVLEEHLQGVDHDELMEMIHEKLQNVFIRRGEKPDGKHEIVIDIAAPELDMHFGPGDGERRQLRRRIVEREREARDAPRAQRRQVIVEREREARDAPRAQRRQVIVEREREARDRDRAARDREREARDRDRARQREQQRGRGQATTDRDLERRAAELERRMERLEERIERLLEQLERRGR